jgi:hypothetical protein
MKKTMRSPSFVVMFLLLLAVVGTLVWNATRNEMATEMHYEGPVAIAVQQSTPRPTPTAVSWQEVKSSPASGWQISTELEARPLQICAGETVAWRNMQPDTPVVLTAEDGSFSSGVIDPGEEFARTFLTPGGVITITVTAVNGDANLEPWTVEVTRCEN